ncbi:hypothetical protein CANARDRAFT_173622 [[Candida] arabinofermentans NRRL YB-2248]|uniref:F-box domain-containing protein n=1 Tax=[Candida] arabinofermentans NRRL YB-2248 TaxID=983967 RepID=A0A1E4T7I4_9ASCO|nr:hypothetical protein CANARDRAFT_173622 [[Candida] arabinofermentans NRRL YB-2248]
MDTTSTFIKLMAKLPLELQYRVMSFIEWDEYPVEALLQLTLYGSSLLKSTLAEQLLKKIEWDSYTIRIGLGFEIEIDSFSFEMLLDVMKRIRSQTNMQSRYVTETLNILSLQIVKDYQFKTIFDNTKHLEISDFESVTRLISFNTNYLKKIKRCKINRLMGVNLDHLELLLNENIEVLEVFSEQYGDNDLKYLEIFFEKLKSINLEQKDLKIILDVRGVSLHRYDFNSLPSFKVPNLHTSLDIESTGSLENRQLSKFISKAFGLESITRLSIYFDDAELNEILFLENLKNLKVLKLSENFKLGSNSRSPVLNLDELDLSDGYANLSNVMAKKMVLEDCEIHRNNIPEGVEKLIETSSLDWDIVRLPLSLIKLDIRLRNDGLEISFENNIDVFKDLLNLKELTIFEFAGSPKLSLPPNLQYFDFKLYRSYSNDFIDFDLPGSLRTLAGYTNVLNHFSKENVPINLETYIVYIKVAGANYVDIMLPKSGLKFLILERLEVDAEGEDDFENVSLRLYNIKSLLEIEVVGDFTESVSVMAPNDDPEDLDKIKILD